MEPYVAARQKEAFFKGYAERAAGVATEDAKRGPLGKIFGPTHYEQGAAFYTARGKIADWQNGVLADIDTFKRLPPAEAAKALSAFSTSLLTGNPEADAIIQAGVIEATGPMLDVIAKERFTWQQTEAVGAMHQSTTSSAAALQGIVSRQAQMGEPTDLDNAVRIAAGNTFLAGLQKPEGMSDESYQAFLGTFMRNQLQNGNFYAVALMRQKGVDQVLTEDQRIKLDDAFFKYGDRALAEAAGAPDIVQRLVTLDTRIKWEDINAVDAMKEYTAINTLLRRRTGVDMDLFDYADIRAIGGNVTDMLVAAARRVEARRWQIEDREDQQRFAREEREAEEERVASQTRTAVISGLASDYVDSGGKREDVDLVMLTAQRNGNLGVLATNFANGGYVSQPVANNLRSGISSHLGEQYTQDFANEHRRWQQLNKLNPGAAKAYYGEFHAPMQRFDQLVRTLPPQVAYQRTFGDPAAYSVQSVPEHRRKGFQAAIPGAIRTHLGRAQRGGRTDAPNPSSVEVITHAIQDHVVTAGNNTSLPTQALVDEAIPSEMAAGRLERAGPLWWRNPTGTVPFYKSLRLQPGEGETVIVEQIDEELKASGYRRGAYGDTYNIIRFRASDGQPVLYVEAMEGGNTWSAIITYRELEDRARKRREGAVRGQNIKPSAYPADAGTTY